MVKKYVDGFVLSIPKDKRNEYKKLAREAAEVWKMFGALDYKECRGDDLNLEYLALPFPKMAKTKENEEVWFSFITYESKAARNKINKQVMKYFDEKYPNSEMEKMMPFDMKRFAQGGFVVEIES
jgi:alkaline phosphatase